MNKFKLPVFNVLVL